MVTSHPLTLEHWSRGDWVCCVTRRGDNCRAAKLSTHIPISLRLRVSIAKMSASFTSAVNWMALSPEGRYGTRLPRRCRSVSGASLAVPVGVFHVCGLIHTALRTLSLPNRGETTMLDCQTALENIVVSASFDEGFGVTVSTPSMTVGGFPSLMLTGKSDPGTALSVMFLLL